MVLSIEMKMLFWASVLGIVQLLLATAFATKERGISWNVSARDQKMPELTGVPARLDRAFKNFMETFAFFAVGALIVQITGMANITSSLGAQLYMGARVLYVPIYALGIPVIRSLIWLVSLIGLLMVLSALL